MLIAQNHSATKQIFHHGHSTVHARFVQAIVVKQGNLFLLYLRDGDILTPSEQGLYFHDMRYLSLQTLRLNGSQLVSRQASVSECADAAFDLTNPDLLDAAGNRCVRKETLGIQRRKCLGGTYTETLTIHNYTWEPAVFTLTLHYEADFVDMFVVQGATPTKRGTLHEPQWQESTLCFRYDGADGRTRSTTIHFSQPPDEYQQQMLTYHLALPPQQHWQLKISCELLDQDGGPLGTKPNASEGPGAEQLCLAHEGVMGTGMGVETSNRLFNEVLPRSFIDLHMLSMRQQHEAFFAAGVPWYVALY